MTRKRLIPISTAGLIGSMAVIALLTGIIDIRVRVALRKDTFELLNYWYAMYPEVTWGLIVFGSLLVGWLVPWRKR